jgi:WD40 repeat protein
LKGHQKPVNCIDINSFNNLLASGSTDKLIIIWDLETTKKLYSLTGHSKSVEVVKVEQKLLEIYFLENIYKFFLSSHLNA